MSDPLDLEVLQKELILAYREYSPWKHRYYLTQKEFDWLALEVFIRGAACAGLFVSLIFIVGSYLEQPDEFIWYMKDHVRECVAWGIGLTLDALFIWCFPCTSELIRAFSEASERFFSSRRNHSFFKKEYKRALAAFQRSFREQRRLNE